MQSFPLPNTTKDALARYVSRDIVGIIDKYLTIKIDGGLIRELLCFYDPLARNYIKEEIINTLFRNDRIQSIIEGKVPPVNEVQDSMLQRFTYLRSHGFEFKSATHFIHELKSIPLAPGVDRFTVFEKIPGPLHPNVYSGNVYELTPLELFRGLAFLHIRSGGANCSVNYSHKLGVLVMEMKLDE